MKRDYELEFRRGARDCRNGVRHLPDQPLAYDEGFSMQYAAEQEATSMGLIQDSKMEVKS